MVGQQVGFTPPATRPCACPPHIGCAPPATESGREAVETSSRQAWIKFQKPPKPATALVYLTEIATQGNFYSKRSVRSACRWAAIGAMIGGWRIKQNKCPLAA